MLYARLLSPPSGSFFLFGPRGTGKSTWLGQVFPGAPTSDLLDEGLFHSLLSDPGLFARMLRVHAPGTLVVVDEIQRLPSLLNEVHRHMERGGLSFALCGSSARKLTASGTNLLAGRAVRLFLHPFLPAELGEEFDLEEAYRFGCLPVVLRSPDKRDALEAYVQMYLREEIQAEALVRNLPGYARFLQVAALAHGQTVNTAGIARDTGAARSTVQGYLEILEDTLLAFRLSPWTPRLKQRETRHPKLYWADPGVVRAARRRLDPPAPEERGHLLEGWIAGVLRAYRDYRNLFDDWGWWRGGTSGRHEVDFLLRKGDRLSAIEVKAGRMFDERWAAGLRAVAALEGMERRVVVYTGERRQATEDGVEILPVREFLRELEGGSWWRQAAPER